MPALALTDAQTPAAAATGADDAVRVAHEAPDAAREIAPVPAAGDRSAQPAGSSVSGPVLFAAITALRNDCDRGGIERLKELRSLAARSDRLLQLLDAHVEAQARFLEGLREIRARLIAEATI